MVHNAVKLAIAARYRTSFGKSHSYTFSNIAQTVSSRGYVAWPFIWAHRPTMNMNVVLLPMKSTATTKESSFLPFLLFVPVFLLLLNKKM